jgi:hypothetical protein
MKKVIFLVAFMFGWLVSFRRFDPHDASSGPVQPQSNPQDASSYGPLTPWPCALPDVCVHARRRRGVP